MQVHFDNLMFVFKFSRKEERLRVLEADLSIIAGQSFIITPWSPMVDKAKERILSILVWARFTHIPSVLQLVIGLNRLASKLRCFDANIIARSRLVYAKALIEVTPDKLFPTRIPMRIAEGHVSFVDVHYS